MRSEVLFVVGYALALLAGAVGLDRLGRTSHQQRLGRLRGGPTRGHTGSTTTADAAPGWPHSEVPRFYSAMALVAAAASIILSVGELLGRHHRFSETVLLMSVLVLAVLTLGWIGTRLD